jgi:excisionase family DNA binding protein
VLLYGNERYTDMGGTVSAEAATGRTGRLVRLRDAAPVLDIPLSTLRRLCALGEVPATKVGRGWRVKGAYMDEVTAWAGEAS